MAASIPSTSVPTISSNGKVKVLANVQSDNKFGFVGEKSLKSQRTYQVGVVYKDIYGRETPVFTSGSGSFTVPKDLSDKRNGIIANLQNQAPSWVDTFKFFVKETSNEYYNACMDRWYDAEDDNLWLSFPSAERNKIKEDGFIILKKQAASDDAVHEEARYKVIDIQNEAPDFIKTDYEMYGSDTIEVMANGALPGSKTIKFDINGSTNSWDTSVFYDALIAGDPDSGNTAVGTSDTGFIGWPLEDVVIKISNTGGTNTGWLDVANIYKDTDIFVELSKPLLGEVDSTNAVTVSSAISNIILNPGAVADVQVKFAKRVVKNKAEFDGKFFVKIARDAVLDQKVREVGNLSASFSVTNQVDQYHLSRTSSSGSSAVSTAKTYWEKVSQSWFIDNVERGEVGSQVVVNYHGPFDRDDGYGIKGNSTGKRENDAQTYLQCTMELTLNKIKDNDKDGYDISNNTQENQNFLNIMSQEGTLFRWKEDPFQHVYRVVGTPGDSRNENAQSGPPNKTWKRGILNYSSTNSERKDKDNKSIRLYLKFITTGWRLNAVQNGSTYGGTYQFFEEEEGLYPFNYTGEYTETSNGTAITWDPTKRGFGEYTTTASDTPTDGTGDITQTTTIGGGLLMDETNRNTIQVLSMEVGDKEPTFTKDPAVWETEPREDAQIKQTNYLLPMDALLHVRTQ